MTSRLMIKSIITTIHQIILIRFSPDAEFLLFSYLSIAPSNVTDFCLILEHVIKNV